MRSPAEVLRERDALIKARSDGARRGGFPACKLERKELWDPTSVWATRLLDDPTCDEETCLFHDPDVRGCGLIAYGVALQTDRRALAWLLARREARRDP
ncbi:MAG: hypothetical protein WEB06_10880 [Actinomycetota bacterium]